MCGDKCLPFLSIVRLDESCEQLSASQGELMQHKRKTVQLEKQLGKAALKLDQNNSNKPGTQSNMHLSRIIGTHSFICSCNKSLRQIFLSNQVT